MNDERLAYPLPEVAAKLGGISVRSVQRLIASGALKAVRVGRRVLVPADALRAFLKNIRLTNGLPMVKHCVMNEIIKVNGDEATAKSYIVVVRSKGEGALVNGIAGRYEDQLVKQGDRWLFKNRKVHFDLMGDMR